jgi:uncharacterized membrane protein YpjA
MFMKLIAALTLLATIYGVWPPSDQIVTPAPVVIIISHSPGSTVDMSKNSNVYILK